MKARASTLVVLLVVTVPVLAGCLGGDGRDPVPGEGPLAGLAVVERRLSPPDVASMEVTIAVDPTDPARALAASNSADRGGFGVYATDDAGGTWTYERYGPERVAPTAPGTSRFTSLSDPVVAFGPDGTAYLMGLAHTPTSAIMLAASTDGGTTWSDGVVVHESDPITSFNDKEWLAVGPTTGTLVATWQKEPARDMLRDVEFQTGLDVDIGDIVVTRSTDGGATWAEPTVVSRGMHNNGTQIAFSPDGTAHLMWVNYEEHTLDHARSTDDGATWSEPVPVADVQIVPPYPRYGRMHTLPALVASPTGPELFAVWHDRRDGDADTYAVASPDGGQTWTEPTRVNQDTPGNGVLQLYPWAAVGPDGTLYVGFYDSRDDPDHPRFRYYVTATEGDPTHLAFAGAVPVSSEPFTAFQSPNGTAQDPDPEGEHRSFGDYTGLAASAAGVYAAWADGRHDEEAAYAARIDVA